MAGINYLFEQLMTPELGDTAYGDGQRLVCGAPGEYQGSVEVQFLPDDETIAHADAVAGIGIGRNGAYWAGQLPCFYECQAGEQCRRMTALRKCGGAMCGCQC